MSSDGAERSAGDREHPAVQSGQTLHTRCLDCSFVSEYNNLGLNSYAPVNLVKKMQHKLAQS